MYTLSTRSLAPTVDQIPLSPPPRVSPFFLTRWEKNYCITPPGTGRLFPSSAHT